jgi:hypothetical protein
MLLHGGQLRTCVAMVLVVLTCAASAHAAVLVESTFDTAVTGQNPPAPWQRFEYAGVFTQGVPVERQLQIVPDPRRYGRSAKFVVNPGDRYGGSSGERALLSLTSSSGHSSSPEREGDDYFYSWSNLFPADWSAPPQWGIVLEFHGDNRFLLAPLRVNTRGNEISLDLTTGPCVTALVCAYRRSFPIARAIVRDRWQDFILHVRWTKSNQGAVAVWHRVESGGWKRVLRLRRIPTLPSFAGQPDTAIDLLFGLYTGPGTTTRVLYGDNFAQTTTFADAAAVFPRLRKHK